MNILYSDRFAEGFAQLGNVADQQFWEGVQETFEGQDEAHTTFTLEMMKFSVTFITLTLAELLEKIYVMWKSLNVEYKAALSQFYMEQHIQLL